MNAKRLVQAILVAAALAWSVPRTARSEAAAPAPKPPDPAAAQPDKAKPKAEKPAPSPEQLAEMKNKAKTNLEKQAADTAGALGKTQTRCAELTAQMNAGTVSLTPPSPETIGQLRQSRTKGWTAPKAQAAKPDPLALEVPNNDILKNALKAAADAHTLLATAQTRQKEELDKAVAVLAAAQGPDLQKTINEASRGNSPETTKALQDAQTAVAKAETDLLTLCIKTWLAGIETKVQTDAAKGAAARSRAAFDAFLTLETQRLELLTKINEQAKLFQEAMQIVVEESKPKKAPKAEKPKEQPKPKEGGDKPK
jgi:hypothetical protein